LGVLVAAPLLAKNVLFTLLIPFAAIFLIVMVLDAKWMTLLLLYTRSLMDPILVKTRFGGEGGAGIGAVLNLLVIALVVSLIMRYPKELSGQRRFIKSWLIFLFFCAVSIVFAPNRVRCLKFMINFSTYLSVAIIPFIIVKNQQDKRFWIKTLFYSSFLPVAFSCFKILQDHTDRVRGTFTHPNILAFYIMTMIVIVFYVLKTGEFHLTLAKKFWLCAYTFVLIAVLLLTRTRGAWLACLVIFSIYALLKEPKYLFVLALTVPLLLLTPQVQTRLTDLRSGYGETRHGELNSMYWRIKLWESSLESIKQKPIFGHGLGSFEFYSVDFFALETYKGMPAHNSYLELLFETGVAGLLSYLGIFLVVLKIFYARIKDNVRSLSLEATLAFAMAIGYLLIGFSDNTLHYLAYNWYFWFFTGLILQSLNLSAQQVSQPSQDGTAVIAP
jgi:O-antigen ligase